MSPALGGWSITEYCVENIFYYLHSPPLSPALWMYKHTKQSPMTSLSTLHSHSQFANSILALWRKTFACRIFLALLLDLKDCEKEDFQRGCHKHFNLFQSIVWPLQGYPYSNGHEFPVLTVDDRLY